MKNTGKSFVELAKIMRKLLSEKGCPWDRKQTHASLMKYLYEEADEVAKAVRRRDWDNLEEELGDILLQVVFHAELARRGGRFDINDVVSGLNKKLVRRHPHVFGGGKLKTPQQVLLQWDEIKRREKRLKIKTGKPAKT